MELTYGVRIKVSQGFVGVAIDASTDDEMVSEFTGGVVFAGFQGLQRPALAPSESARVERPKFIGNHILGGPPNAHFAAEYVDGPFDVGAGVVQHANGVNSLGLDLSEGVRLQFIDEEVLVGHS